MDFGVELIKLWLKREIAYQGGPVKKMEKNPI
jgi:hypothetical protein